MKQVIGAEELIESKLKKVGIVRDVCFQKKEGDVVDGYVTMQKKHPVRLINLERAFPQAVERALLKAENISDDGAYFIIVAPYVSPASADVCKRMGAGYADYSGNCLIALEGLYLSDMGHPNLFPKEEKAKNIFRSSSVVTSRILRELLSDVSVTWKLQKLSVEVGCSIGRVFAINLQGIGKNCQLFVSCLSAICQVFVSCGDSSGVISLSWDLDLPNANVDIMGI